MESNISMNEILPEEKPPFESGAFLNLNLPKFKPIPPPALEINVYLLNVSKIYSIESSVDKTLHYDN